LLMALLTVDLLLPYFNTITGKQLTLRIGTVLLPFLGITLLTGLLAGSYPALYLSGFSPAAVLKGRLNSSLGEVWARKGLVIFQFALSVIFIIGVTVVYKQIEFTQSKNLGYERAGVIYFSRQGKLWQSNETLETFLDELRRIPGVVHASATNHDMTGHFTGSSGITWPGRDPEDRTEFEVFQVDYDMMETLGLEMAEGRMFSRDFNPDTSRVIFNEAAIAFMNNMQQPVGKTVRMWDKNVEIIGVVKNFHYESLHQPLKPVVFRYAPQNAGNIMARLEAGREKETLERLTKFYSTFNEGFTLDYRFLDQEYEVQYAAEQRVSVLSRYFAGLAILISCLGLFGLAAFTAERRLKEIGIRKVLGSTELNIVLILSSDFTRIVLTAITIALPVSYLLIRQWLSSFAFRIELHWWYFATAGVLALVICWLTVGTQAIKAARVNPTKCLKEQ
jgi:putative ABC transport system permease protein